MLLQLSDASNQWHPAYSDMSAYGEESDTFAQVDAALS
jgi:hypothetical protein